MVTILIRVVVNALAVWAATIIPGISLTGSDTGKQVGTLLLVAVIFGVINAVLKPIIKVLGCGLYVLTLGLISFVVNALLFGLAGWVAEQLRLPFEVELFWPAFWGAIVVSIVSFGINMILPDSAKKT